MSKQQDLVAQENKNTETAVAQASAQAVTFNLPALTDPQEAAEIMEANMEGMGEMRFDQIKMPSGGGISFEIIDEDGEAEPVKEIRGVILDKFPFKAWYIKSFDEKGEDDDGVPDCYSADNVHGSGCEDAEIPAGQLCKDCSKGQWNSDRKGGKGKDCADKVRIHILLEGEVFPKYIDAPPTSLGNFKEYVKRLANKMKPFYGVVTKVGLEKAKSGGNIVYSKATFSKSADLTSDERVAIKNYINTLLPSMRKVTRESIGDATTAKEEEAIDVSGQAAVTGEQLY